MYALGDAAADQAQLTALQQTLHNLALSKAMALRYDPTDSTGAAAALQQQWTDVKAQVDALVKQLRGAESPSGAMLDLSSFSDSMLAAIQKYWKPVAIVIGATLVLGLVGTTVSSVRRITGAT